MKLTIDTFSQIFKMSKEMIHSKLKNKKLSYVVEGGVTYIIVPKHLESQVNTSVSQVQKPAHTPAVKKPQKTTVAMVIALYQKENQQLKEKIIQLETKIDKLIDDKEQMLRQEMQKIEQVYAQKDEQLKTILELVNTQLKTTTTETIHDVQAIQTPSPLEEPQKEEIVELKEYLKTLDLESYQKKVIKKRFLAAYGSDIRVIKQNGKLYLNFTKYDYSDLLEY